LNESKYSVLSFQRKYNLENTYQSLLTNEEMSIFEVRKGSEYKHDCFSGMRRRAFWKEAANISEKAVASVSDPEQ
jgi:hypothetical protein